MGRFGTSSKRGIAVIALAVAACVAAHATAEDVSSPAMLQIFEADWTTIENRMADIHEVGYGRLWLPPPARADSGNQSVGYDVYERFDLGKPRNETLYGTETGLKTLVRMAHRAGVLVNTDFIANHNGFSDSSTVDNRGTPANPADDVTFVQAGDYPGFVTTLPGDIDGDFHGAFEGGQENFRLSGLIDIAQDKNHWFIRHPTAAGNPQNIPAGTQGIFGRPPADVPDSHNARFYPDQGLGGTNVYNPGTGQNVTLYDFNTSTPLAGDPVLENATALLMRNARWMIQEVGVDGFRFDAGRHFPRWVFDYLDQAMFRAKTETLLDGSPQHVFSFTETGYDNDLNFLQSFIRKDINNGNLGQVGGNRDVLDFNLFGNPFEDRGLHHNLSANGFQNNWHKVKNASIDLNDDALMNGSQGVKFAQSHDEVGPYLQDVAYAYILMLPGNAIVYTNAKEYGNGRDFPRGGKDDALGGFHGETITKLVDIRNTHGRGNFHERWIDFDNGEAKSNIYVYERENSAVVGLNSRVESGFDQRTVSTGFAPNTVLVELTGNATDSVVDPYDDIKDVVRVNGSGQLTMSIPRNESTNFGGPGTEDDVETAHLRGYVVYGLPTPQGTLSLSNVSQVLQGDTPTAANNGTARLADIDVITTNTFNVRLDTTPVSLQVSGEPTPYRDVDADGDNAMIKIDGGMNVNSMPGIDHTTPGSVVYGFEEFTGTKTPGYFNSGVGVYEQPIDATQLAEGRHYLTVRAFRHRDSGPAVFSDFKRTIYVDRVAPESAVVSFEPFAPNPGNPNNRDLIARSVDSTANNMHIYLDLPAATTDAQIYQMVQNGLNDAGSYDRDSFVFGFNNVRTGNHVATVVTFEETGNYSIRRFPALFTATNLGAGFGDLNTIGDTGGAGRYTVNDIRCSGACANFSAEHILYSQNTQFRAAFDVNGDGLGDNRDLFALGDELIDGGSGQTVLNAYTDLLLKRGDFNASGATNSADVAALYGQFGPATWLYDLNVDGFVNITDVSTMITEVFRTVAGDIDLDGAVDSRDYVLLRKGIGTIGATYAQGDADLDGDVDAADLNIWERNYGFVRQPLQLGNGASSAVPEPSSLLLLITLTMLVKTLRPRLREGSDSLASRSSSGARPSILDSRHSYPMKEVL